MTKPAPVIGVVPPVTGNNVFPELGGAKFVKFRMLKNSALNWTLNASEIAGILLFLKIDKSRFFSPGPVSELRVTFPSLVSGLGEAKQLKLMYWT